jgi:tRNA dimethylallyltransferase
MVGGSGLYVDAVLKGFDEFPDIEEGVRTKINRKFDALGIEFLKDKLKQLDPDYYKKMEIENPQTLQNPQRMKRFVEVCIGSGLPYSDFIGKRKIKRNFTPIVIGLEADREILYDRINQRVDLMFEAGLVEEVKQLLPHKERNALQTVGYRELFDYFEGKSTLEFAKEQIKQNTRRFAKRQMTWFKRTENAIWFDYETKINTVINDINKLTVI